MHLLLHDHQPAHNVAYERFLRRVQIRGLLLDHLVDGAPYLTMNSLVLSDADHAALRDASQILAKAFVRAGRVVARDVGGLVEMGFPWLAAELLASETPAQPVAGRFDFLCDQSGHWWLLEFNADTPSGIREAIVCNQELHDLVSAAKGLVQPNADLKSRLIASVLDALSGQLPRGVLGLVTDAGELEDLAQMAYTQRILSGPLSARGVRIVLGDINNLTATRGWATLCGERIGALYRYFPYEAMLGEAALPAIYEAASLGHLRILNGLFGLLLQHKGLMAWIWAHRDDPLFSPPERESIRRHLVPTWTIRDSPVTVPRASLVAKQVFGREGEEVFFGDATEEEAWKQLGAWRTYVTQERIQAQQIEGVIQGPVGSEPRSGTAVVGCYVTNGVWAGYYTRFGGRIITSNASWIATLIEGQAET